ncbi:MAG: hypothetical protein L0Y36_06945 [Planctomycetales bacterium]|nr:hypothetical protein [Planctomycetales bacterium]
MGENVKCFIKGLPVCLIFAGAAAVAAVLYRAATDYTTYYTALKIYSVGWFAACILSFYCGLLVVPRSLAIVFSFAGLVGFALVCALDPAFANEHPLLCRAIETIPAWFFLFAWAAAAVSACRSDVKKIRISSWLWLAVFLTLLLSWGAFHLAQFGLTKQRAIHLADACVKARKVIDTLAAWQAEHAAYPDTLAEAGITDDQTALLYRNKRLNYFGRQSTYILTLEDPMLGDQTLYAYDTTEGGWSPDDPQSTLNHRLPHMFLGFLRQR